MPNFQHPPDWWINLAYLTQWLYWPAISALLSSCAILFTIRLADRGRRDSRRREGAFLRSVAYLVHGANAVAGACIQGLWKNGDGDKAAEAIHLTFDQIQLYQYLQEIKITDFPDEESLHSFLVGRLSVRNIILEAKEALDERRPIDHDVIISEAKDIDECAFFLRDRANHYSKYIVNPSATYIYNFSPPTQSSESQSPWWKFWRLRLVRV